MIRIATPAVLLAILSAACGGSGDAARTDGRGTTTVREQPPAPGTVTHGDSTTDLDTTPISAADYAMYTAIMGGASAMLSTASRTRRNSSA